MGPKGRFPLKSKSYKTGDYYALIVYGAVFVSATARLLYTVESAPVVRYTCTPLSVEFLDISMYFYFYVEFHEIFSALGKHAK